MAARLPCWYPGRQNGDEVPGPAEKILIRRADLASHALDQGTAGPVGVSELHPLLVDIEFHADPGPEHDEGDGQIAGSGRHAGRVDQLTPGVLTERAPGGQLDTGDGSAPGTPAAGRRRRLPAAGNQQVQVLPDAVDRAAWLRDSPAPDADAGGTRAIDHQAGPAARQRLDDLARLLVAARASRQLEAAIE